MCVQPEESQENSQKRRGVVVKVVVISLVSAGIVMYRSSLPLEFMIGTARQRRAETR
jgi:hypothetical protein